MGWVEKMNTRFKKQKMNSVKWKEKMNLTHLTKLECPFF